MWNDVENQKYDFCLFHALMLFYLNSTSMSTPPPGETIPWTMFTQTATKSSPVLIFVNQTIFPCFSCLLTPNWLKGSNHQKHQLKCGQMKLQQLSTDWHMFRDAATQENHINLDISDIIHQQMCWWCGDHEDNKIIPQPESLDEWRSEG